MDIGECVRLWTPEYLAANGGSGILKSGVHVSAAPTVDLAGHRKPGTPKNFTFCEMAFAEFIQRCAPEAFPDRPRHPPRIQAGESLYLRSVAPGLDASRRPTHLKESFPGLAGDVTFPEGLIYDKEDYHTSVLRVSTGDTQLWTHYDVMHNVLIQVTGTKRVLLWPPSEAHNLYTEGTGHHHACQTPSLRTSPDFPDSRTQRTRGSRRLCALGTRYSSRGSGSTTFLPNPSPSLSTSSGKRCRTTSTILRTTTATKICPRGTRRFPRL
ncbi:cupin-like domain-containing protein [Baffinella frigidus]|nr:cupin-like domain-containing protein [Cryptophyta sp. CCMP2293]